MRKSMKVVLFLVSLHPISQVSCMKDDTPVKPNDQNGKSGPEKQNWEDALKKMLSQLPPLKIPRRDEGIINLSLSDISSEQSSDATKKESEDPPLIGSLIISITTALHNLFSCSVEEKN